MIKKWFDYLTTHGVVVMVVGFLTAVVSLFVYMQTRYSGSATPRIAFGCTIAGFIIYIIGRAFVAAGRRRSTTRGSSPTAAEDDS